jgi:Secretion system C-terminal sorting domain
VVENNFWYFTNTYDNIVDPVYTTEYRMYLSGDTLIDGMTYKKIYGIDWQGDLLVGMIREDSTRKVFIRGNAIFANGECNDSIIDGAEVLLYDFGLSAGDTIVGCMHSDKILEIDSIDVDGTLRRRFKIENNAILNEEYWIEGIGSTLGLFGSFVYEFENFWKLRCFKNMDLTFTNGDSNIDENCNTIVDAIALDIKQVNIFPNPTNSSLHIENLEVNETVMIYSLMGQILIKEQATTNILELDVSNLPNGVYLVGIKRSERISIAGNFLKY